MKWAKALGVGGGGVSEVAQFYVSHLPKIFNTYACRASHSPPNFDQSSCLDTGNRDIQARFFKKSNSVYNFWSRASLPGVITVILHSLSFRTVSSDKKSTSQVDYIFLNTSGADRNSTWR